MRKLLRYSVVGFAIFVPLQSCTLLTDIDRGEIPNDGSAGTAGAQGGEPQGGRSGGGGAGAGAGAGRGGEGNAGTGGTSGGADAGEGGEAGEPPISMGGDGGTSMGGTGGTSDDPSAGAGGTVSCESTLCGEACVDMLTNTDHCGGCDRPCTDENVAELRCASGRCNSTCEPGFANCTRPIPPAEDDGCETDLSSTESCGTSCANVTRCSSGQECIEGQCLSPCAQTRCGTTCANLTTNVENCGACGRACLDDDDTESVTCAAGVCEQVCEAGYANCSKPPGSSEDDGCETNLNSQETCGTTCGNVVECEEDESCVAGVCTPINQCVAPNEVCGEECVNVQTGVDADTTVDHCGECDRTCSLAGASSSNCAEGECEPTCTAGFADCNQPGSALPDDGCETNVGSGMVSGATITNCGSCGRACGTQNVATAGCAASRCAPTCTAGFGDCVPDSDGVGVDDGCETNVRTGVVAAGTVDHCGACGTTCSLSNATSTTCTDGACVPTCSAGFAKCTTPGVNQGCETNTRADSAHCGACARSCAQTPGTESQACVNGRCAPVCRAGYGDCTPDDGAADDGCETNFNALNTCGTACGTLVTCAATEVCNAGTCGEPVGLAVLTVPFTAAEQSQRYGMNFATAVDLTNATVTLRVHAPDATGSSLLAYLTDADFTANPTPLTQTLAPATAGWVDVSLNAGTAEGTYDPSAITNVVIEIVSTAQSSFTEPTIVYVDSVVSSNGAVDEGFATSAARLQRSALVSVPSAELGWAAGLP